MSRGRARARSPEDQELVRQKFLACARTVFSTTGAHGLTMRRLAAEAGYSPGTIYLYFSSRQDLLWEIWREDMVGLYNSVREAFEAPDAAPLRVLRNVLAAYATFWLGKPDHFRGMFMENDREYLDERASFVGDDSVQKVHDLLLAATAAALPDTAPEPEQIRLMTHSLLAAVHGVVALHIGAGAFPWAPAPAMLDVVLDSLLSGLNPTRVGAGAA